MTPEDSNRSINYAARICAMAADRPDGYADPEVKALRAEWQAMRGGAIPEYVPQRIVDGVFMPEEASPERSNPTASALYSRDTPKLRPRTNHRAKGGKVGRPPKPESEKFRACRRCGVSKTTIGNYEETTTGNYRRECNDCRTTTRRARELAKREAVSA
jgi:hypothetical protein